MTESQAVNMIKYLEKQVGTKKKRFQTIMNTNTVYPNQLKYRTNKGPMSLKYLNTFSTTSQKNKLWSKKYPMSLGTQLCSF